MSYQIVQQVMYLPVYQYGNRYFLDGYAYRACYGAVPGDALDMYHEVTSEQIDGILERSAQSEVLYEPEYRRLSDLSKVYKAPLHAKYGRVTDKTPNGRIMFDVKLHGVDHAIGWYAANQGISKEQSRAEVKNALFETARDLAGDYLAENKFMDAFALIEQVSKDLNAPMEYIIKGVQVAVELERQKAQSALDAYNILYGGMRF